MGQYDLIAFDMDGTLLTSAKTVSPGTKAAIRRAVTEGKTVVLATGRSPSELREYAEDFTDIRYYICENGTLIYDSFAKKILYVEHIPGNIVESIMEIARNEDTMVFLDSLGSAIVSRSDADRMEHFQVAQYKNLILQNAVLLEDEIIDHYMAEPFPIEKLNLFSADIKVRERMYKKVKALPVTAIYSEETAMEISPLNISKGSGLKKFCELFDIPLERTIMVGDADNDMEALRTAGLSVAMGNGRDYVKEICDRIVADNDHDGCAEAIDILLS